MAHEYDQFSTTCRWSTVAAQAIGHHYPTYWRTARHICREYLKHSTSSKGINALLLGRAFVMIHHALYKSPGDKVAVLTVYSGSSPHPNSGKPPRQGQRIIITLSRESAPWVEVHTDITLPVLPARSLDKPHPCLALFARHEYAAHESVLTMLRPSPLDAFTPRESNPARAPSLTPSAHT